MAKKSQRPPEIWITLSGKGGTGATFILSQLARELTLRGKRVVAVDYHAGAPNLHTFFDLTGVKQTLSHFIRNQQALDKLVHPTPVKNLGLIPGDFLSLLPPDIKKKDFRRFLKEIETLACDFVLIDLGCEVDRKHLDIYLAAQKLIAITIPETIAVNNLFVLLRTLQMDRLNRIFARMAPGVHIEDIWHNRHDFGINTLTELITHMSQICGDKKITESAHLPLKLVLNKVRTPIEINQGFSIRSVARKYLDVNMQYVGYVEYDNLFWKGFSLIERKKITVSSRIQQEVSLAVDNLLEDKELKIDKTKNV